MDWTVKIHKKLRNQKEQGPGQLDLFPDEDGKVEVEQFDIWTQHPWDLLRSVEYHFRRIDYICTKMEIINKSQKGHSPVEMKVTNK